VNQSFLRIDRSIPQTSATDTETSASEESSYMDELQQLAKLHEQGILTDEEFAAKKAQILGL
jgi:hypothetical protein